MRPIYIATEDSLSEAVAHRLVAEVNRGLYVAVSMGRKGNGYLKNRFPELSRTARSLPVLLLTDLDRIDCAPTLITAWSQNHAVPSGLLFRVVVREIETWLMADRQGFANFFDVPLVQLSRDPEHITDPKQCLLHLIRRYSKKEIKAAILPDRNSRGSTGLGYNQMMSRFVEQGWSINRAMTASASLAKAYQRLTELSASAPA